MTRRNMYILAALVLVLIVAGYWFFLLGPLRANIAETEEELKQEHQNLSAAQAKLAQMEQTRRDAKKNRARLIELAKMVPEEPEVPSLLLQIQDLATEAGIEFMSIAPSEPDENSGYATIGLSLQFTGSFFDLTDFLYRSEQLAGVPGRLLATKSLGLGIADAEASPPQLQASIQMLAFTRSQQATPEAE